MRFPLPLLVCISCAPQPARPLAQQAPTEPQEVSTPEPPEWGGFRGNNSAGIAMDAELPDVLNMETNLLWRTEIPKGYSSPTICGEQVFITGADREQLFTLCLDRNDGEVTAECRVTLLARHHPILLADRVRRQQQRGFG